MFGQYLSNKNESATVSKSKNFLDINKAYIIFPSRRGSKCKSLSLSIYTQYEDSKFWILLKFHEFQCRPKEKSESLYSTNTCAMQL